MITGILFLAIIVCVVLYAYVDGSFLNWFFMTVEEGSMKFVVKGEDYVRTVLNVRGKRMDENDELIENGPLPPSFSLFRMLGLHFIGIPPFFRVHKFDLVTGELVSEEEQQTKPVHAWVVSRKHPKTTRLDLRIRTYSAIKGVELADGSTVDVVIFSLLEVTNPRLAIFVHKADFAAIAASAISSGYVDEMKKYKYASSTRVLENGQSETTHGFLHTPKGRGSLFSQDICAHINTGGGKVAKKIKPLEKVFGVKLLETFVYEFQLSEGEVGFNKATRAAEVARLEGEGRINEAVADAKAIETRAAAEAKRLGLSLAAARAENVDANVAMGNITTIRAMESGAARQTWVQAGAVSVGNLFPQQQEQHKPINPTTPEGDTE